MALKEIHCPNCGSTKLTTQKKTGVNGNFTVVAACEYCGSHFTTDLAEGEEIYIEPEPERPQVARSTAAQRQAEGTSNNTGCYKVAGIFVYFWVIMFASSTLMFIIQAISGSSPSSKGGSIGAAIFGIIFTYLLHLAGRALMRKGEN